MDIQLKKRRSPISRKTITIIAIAAGVAIAPALVPPLLWCYKAERRQ